MSDISTALDDISQGPGKMPFDDLGVDKTQPFPPDDRCAQWTITGCMIALCVFGLIGLTVSLRWIWRVL